MNKRWLVAAFVVAALGCGKSESKEKPAEPAPKPTTAGKTEDAGATKQGTSGRHRAKDDSDWVPAEFKRGRAKWKESSVYVDGVPVGVLKHGELPLGMEPLWSGDDDPGDPDTKRFKIMQYLEKVGVDVDKIKAVHIYGGRQHTAVMTGDEARKHRDTLLFRFGLGTRGKTLIAFPNAMKMNTYFDKLTAICVYIDKEVPTLNPDTEHIEIDGKVVWKIPYFGDPIRGGVRIYKDNRLALHLKRHKLDEDDALPSKNKDDPPRYKLATVLSKAGVDMSDVVVGQVIRSDQRQEVLSKEQLAEAVFAAKPQSSGMIVLNDTIEVRALALHTKPLPKQPKSPNKK